MIPDIGFREGFVSWDGKDEHFVQLNGINKFEKIKKGSKVYHQQLFSPLPGGHQHRGNRELYCTRQQQFL
jgi:hypothetical protein